LKKIFGIFLSLALVLSLGVLATAPVAAAELPSLSPNSATVDLDNPVQLAFNINWGTLASSINAIDELIGGGPTLTPNSDYFVFDTLLVIDSSYLTSRFSCVGDIETLMVTFDVGVVFVDLDTVGTAPSIAPTSADYDFYGTPGVDDVQTIITWNLATVVSKIEEIVGGVVVNTLATPADYGVTAIDADTSALNITEAYLAGRLTAIGDEVELTITFDSCDWAGGVTTDHTAILTIEAVGALKPSLSPTSEDYDWYGGGDVTFDITWDGAANIVNIEWWTIPLYSYAIPANAGFPFGVLWDDSGTTLTLKDVLFSGFLPYIHSPAVFGDDSLYGPCTTPYVMLRCTFDDSAATEVNILVNLDFDQPSFTPDVADVDLEYPYVAGVDWLYGIIDWGSATNITATGAYVNGAPTAIPVGAVSTAWYSPLASFLFVVSPAWCQAIAPNLGDVVTVVAQWDAGCNSTFTCTSIGTEPRISPTSADYNVDEDPCQNVTATIFWGPFATSVDDVLDGDGVALVSPNEYEVVGDTLTIMCDYLATVLLEDGDRITLTIEFDEGEDATLTITAVGMPLCFIATAVYGEDGDATNILREFRDKYMLTNPLGRALVDLYYTVSPPIAQFLTEHPALQPIVRAALMPVVALSTVAVTSAPSTQIAILALLLASVAVAIWATRRRERGPAYV